MITVKNGDLKIITPWFEWTIWFFDRKLGKVLCALRLSRPIYVVVWSRDCDMFESTTARKFYSRWEYRNAEMHMIEWSEGPCSMNEITKQEYNEFKSTFRDRAFEAYEDGRGSNVII